MKYRVYIKEPNSEYATVSIDFDNKPDMYKWITKELNSDKTKQTTFEICQIKE